MQHGADTYDWNAGDNLTSATVGSVTTDMVYRGGGLRDSRTAGEDTVTFTWDVARSIPQVIDDSSLAYVYGLGRIAQVASDDTTYYYLSDGLGSTMALTDADGDVVNTYDYDVFGAVRSSSGSQPNEYQFTGEQVDETTSLQYLRARYYDPATGSFLARDPIPFLQRYAYVWNNPLLLVDPYGLGCRFLGKLCEGVGTAVDKLGDAVECGVDIPGCAKNAVDDYVVAPILERTGHEGAASCVRERGTERCAADWAARQTARILVGEKSYIDLNLTGGLFGIVGTVGVQLSYKRGLHEYAGGGVGSPGVAGSITVGPVQSISTGGACSVQGTAPVYGAAGLTGQVGFGGLGTSGPSSFGEAGLYVGTPGAGWAVTCYYVR